MSVSGQEQFHTFGKKGSISLAGLDFPMSTALDLNWAVRFSTWIVKRKEASRWENDFHYDSCTNFVLLCNLIPSSWLLLIVDVDCRCWSSIVVVVHRRCCSSSLLLVVVAVVVGCCCSSLLLFVIFVVRHFCCFCSLSTLFLLVVVVVPRCCCYLLLFVVVVRSCCCS